jgi:3-oxoacyl-[acyl-carrier-protein] synthase III
MVFPWVMKRPGYPWQTGTPVDQGMRWSLMRGTSCNDSVGISGLGSFIPEAVLTSSDMARLSGIPEAVFLEKIGIERKHIAGPDLHPAEMGARAARVAIGDAGIDPRDLDLIVYCSLGYYDYRFWSPAAKIQDETGAKNAYSFELKNGCNGGNLGLNTCKELLLGDPEKRYALVVCSEKLSVSINYRNKRSLSGFPFADGAVATVLEKNYPGNRLLSYAGITDGSLADRVRIPYGGTRMPPSEKPSMENDCYLSVDDPEGLDRIFSDIYLRNYLSVINEALRKSGYSSRDIDHLFMNQVKKSLTLGILAGLALDESRTMVTMKEYGHMGSVDTLFGLAKAQAEGTLCPGDLVVLAGSAIGFSWAATVLKY